MTLELLPRCCPVCGSQDDLNVFLQSTFEPRKLDEYSFSSRKEPEYTHFRFVDCPTCETLYANPAPMAESIAAAYSDAAYASNEEAKHAAQTYGRLLRKISGRQRSRVGAIDVGAGDGAFLLELLDAGFSNVIGIEPSAAPVQVAYPRVRSLIRQDVFRIGTFPSDSAALITCFQTIEHLSQPLDVCRDAWRILRPGGALFIIAHNRRSFSAAIMGSKSPIFDVEHFQIFSPRSIRFMLKEAGFEKVTVFPILNQYPLHYWVRLCPLPVKLKRLLEFLLAKACIQRLVIPLPAGNLAAIAIKSRLGPISS